MTEGCEMEGSEMEGSEFQLVQHEKIQAQLDLAQTLPDLKALHDRLALISDYVSRMNVALKEQNKIACYRITAARKLGTVLSETVQRGGKGSKNGAARGGSSSGLPDGISHNQSSKWQRLAKISEEVVESYLLHAEEAEQSVTIAALMRVGKLHKSASGAPRARRSKCKVPLGSELTDAITRAMPVDLVVGDDCPKSLKKKHAKNELALKGDWSGRVPASPWSSSLSNPPPKSGGGSTDTSCSQPASKELNSKSASR